MRIALALAIALAVACLGVIQLASDAFASGVATVPSLPRYIPIEDGVRVYGVLDRVAPAPYVEATLAAYEMRKGDLHDAMSYALRLPSSAVRDELLARIAQAQGRTLLAFEYFFAAPDVGALRGSVERIAAHDPVRAYNVEVRIRQRLEELQTHPDAVAEASWMMSTFADAAAYRSTGTRRSTWLHRALRNADAAVALSPLSEKYVLAVAGELVRLGDVRAARLWYERVLAIDPRSPSALRVLSRLNAGYQR